MLDLLVPLLLTVITATATAIGILITNVRLRIIIDGIVLLLLCSTGHFLVVQKGLTSDMAANDVTTMVHAGEVLPHNFIVTLNVIKVRSRIGGLEKGNDIVVSETCIKGNRAGGWSDIFAEVGKDRVLLGGGFGGGVLVHNRPP